MSKPERPFTLKCGDHVLGEVMLDDAENWHCYGKLAAGRDVEQYRRLFGEYLRLNALAHANDSDDSEQAWAAREAAADARDALQDRIDALELVLVDPASGEVSPIHDFHPEDATGRVYWRFGRGIEQLAGVPHNPLMQRTGAAGIVSAIRKLLGRGSGR